MTSYADSWRTAGDIPAVYEKMLKTMLSEPERLSEIAYIMRIVKEDDIIPSTFRDMYKVFRDTLRTK